MPQSTQTEVKISTPIAHKISLGIMMLGAFIGLLAVAYGLIYQSGSETLQKVLPASLRKPVSLTRVFSCEAAPGHRCYYLSPTGNDHNDGLSKETTWYTLGRADDTLRPGDYLYILAGDYNMTTGEHCNSMSDSCDTFRARAIHGGTESEHVTIKNYGNGKATFTITGTYANGAAFDIQRGANWLTIDGLVSGFHRWLIFKANQLTRLIDIGDEDDPDAVTDPQTVHVTIRGVELDGSLADAEPEYLQSAPPLTINNSDFATIEFSYLHDFWKPTGNTWPGICDPAHNPPEECQDPNLGMRNQGTPDCIYVYSSNFFTVKKNLLKKCNHGGVLVGLASDHRTLTSKYGKITDNVIDIQYGGGIYLLQDSAYNLIQNNIIAHAGGTTTFIKPGLQLSGINNTVRANVLYNPSDIAIECDASPTGWEPYKHSCANNLIYNNTIFGSGGGAGFRFFVNNGSGCTNCPPASDVAAENNNFYNNIVYKNRGTYGTSHDEIALDLYHSNFTHNWVDESYPTQLNRTHYGGNVLQNNIIRDENAFSNPLNDQTIYFLGDSDLGWRSNSWSLNQLQNSTPGDPIGDPIAWNNNIAPDPLLALERDGTDKTPDDYGLTVNWWYLQPDSPAINAGIFLPDTNGAHVRDLCSVPNNQYNCQATDGWYDWLYSETAPDIGAYEYSPTQAQTTNVNTNAANTNTRVLNTNIQVPVD